MLTIEGHPLATRTGLFCAACETWALVECDVAVVDVSSCEVLRRVTDSLCAVCGDTDTR